MNIKRKIWMRPGTSLRSPKRLPLIHPVRAEICATIFLQPIKISACAPAQTIKVPRSRLDDIALDRPGRLTTATVESVRY